MVLAAAIVVVILALAGQPWDAPVIPGESAVWRFLAPLPVLLCAVLIQLAPRRPGDTTAWRLLAGGTALWGLAAAVQQYSLQAGVDVGTPFWSDAVWMVAYGVLSAGLLVLAASSNRGLRASALLDPPLAALTVMMLVSAVAMHPQVSNIDEGLRGLIALAYPMWDVVLLGSVAMLLGSTGMRTSGPWLWVAAAALLLAIPDSAHLARTAENHVSPDAWYQPLYSVAFLLLAAGAWARPQPACRVPSGTGLIAAIAASVAAGVLVWDHYDRLSAAAIALSAISLIVVGAQVLLAVRELRALGDADRLAHTDELTGLANRRRLIHDLDREFAANHPVALILLDIDRFKDINGTLGHPLGDHLLTQIGARLATDLPEGPLVARSGGDEFAILVALRTPSHDGRWAAEQVLSSLREPIHLGDLALPVSVSIGIAHAPAQAGDAKSLIRCADIALHHAKDRGTRYEVYDAEHDAFTITRLALGAELHEAIRRDELFVQYQPIVDAHDGRTLSAEALVRWRHPVRGVIPPDVFLPIAEHVGAMGALTDHVLEQALRDCRAWEARGLRINVSVNLAAVNLLDADLPDRVKAALDASGLGPERLQLEVTESGILDDPARAIANSRRLRELGVSLSIDDFGTGHASLAYLRELPLSALKIDRSYVKSMATDPTDSAIVHAAITLSHDLGLSVVIEGVEDVDTWQRAVASGADALQGYLIGRPMAAGDLPAQAQRYPEYHMRLSASAVG